MRYIFLALALAACAKSNQQAAKRDNRAILPIVLVNPKAQCYSVAIALDSTPAFDTAYCVLGADVLWCKANEQTPVGCQKIGTRQAEQPEPTKVTPQPDASPVKETSK